MEYGGNGVATSDLFFPIRIFIAYLSATIYRTTAIASLFGRFQECVCTNELNFEANLLSLNRN